MPGVRLRANDTIIRVAGGWARAQAGKECHQGGNGENAQSEKDIVGCRMAGAPQAVFCLFRHQAFMQHVEDAVDPARELCLRAGRDVRELTGNDMVEDCIKRSGAETLSQIVRKTYWCQQ